MTFQRLAGWALDVNGDRRNSRQDVVVGDNGKRFTGRPMKNNRGFEATINEEICFTAPCCADTLESLFEGMGYYFPFTEDVWSVRSGLGPELSATWTLVSGDGPASTRFHSVIATGSGLLFNPEIIDFTTAPDGGRWTLMYWLKDGGVWTHKVLRVDDSGFIDGVASAAVSGGEVSVSSGGVLFPSGTQIAGLAILPFWICDDAAQAFYDWSTGWNMGGYWRLDRSALDLTGQLNGIISGAPTIAGGQVGNGLRFAADPDGVDIGGAAELSLFNNGVFSIEAQVAADTAGGTGFGCVFGKFSGSAGYRLDVIAGTEAGKLGLQLVVAGTISSTVWVADNVLTAGAFSYVCVTYDASVTGEFAATLRVGSYKTTQWSSYTAGASIGLPNDTAVVGMIGNRNPGDTTRFFDGVLNEVRVSTRVLDADIAYERYTAGKNRRGVPGPSEFAELPAIPLWGEFSGWRLQNFLGDVTTETYEPYSENNDRIMARRIGVTLESVDMETGARIPTPDFGMNPTDERRLSLTSANVRPSRGESSWTGLGGLVASNYGTEGPFAWPNQALTLAGGAYLSNDSTRIPRQFYGRSAITVMMWVRRTLTGTVETFFDTTDTATPTTRLALEFLINDRLSVRYRPTTGTSAVSTVGDPTVIINDTNWHLVGAIVDIANDTAELIIDGRIPYSVATAWTAEEFSDEYNGLTTIGAEAAGTQPFTGDVGAFGLWLRRLTPGEILTVYEKAKRGRFR